MSKIKDVIQYSQKLSVLFVEDEEDARRASKGLLLNFFDLIDVAVDGQDGLDKYQKYYQENQINYDLIITDINMPKMNGRDMIKEIKSINPSQAIVVVSAYHDSNDLIDLIQIGITDFILKPMRSAQLVQVLHTICKTIFLVKEKTNKDAEIAILKERMEMALMANNDGVWDWNMSENKVYLSNRVKEITKIDDDILNSSPIIWLKHIHPTDYKRFISKLEEHLEGKTKFYEDSYRIKCANGTFKWVLSRGKIYVNKATKIKRMIGTLTDITQQKVSALKMVHQSQIIEQIHDSVISTNLAGIIQSCNHGSELLLGYTASEMIGKHITMLYLEEDYPSLEEYITYLKKEGTYNIDICLVKKDKTLIEANLSLSILKDEDDNIIGMISYSQDITKRKEVEKLLKKEYEKSSYKANHDALTQLPNRVLFNDRLTHTIKKAKRYKNIVALLFIDIDHFKEINDTHGHDVGDKVIQAFAKRLKSSLRKEDTVARLGGDEFTIIFDNIAQLDNITNLANMLRTFVHEPINIEGDTFHLTCSIGISIYPNDSLKPHELLSNADSAMYQAKKVGRDTIKFYKNTNMEMNNG